MREATTSSIGFAARSPSSGSVPQPTFAVVGRNAGSDAPARKAGPFAGRRAIDAEVSMTKKMFGNPAWLVKNWLSSWFGGFSTESASAPARRLRAAGFAHVCGVVACGTESTARTAREARVRRAVLRIAGSYRRVRIWNSTSSSRSGDSVPPGTVQRATQR